MGLVAAAESGDGAGFAALIVSAFAPVRVRPMVDGTFHSSLRSAVAGEVRVSVVSGSPCVITRDLDLIDPEDPAYLTVTLQRAGRAGVAQDGRHCLLAPGDLVNYVTSRPYEVTFWRTRSCRWRSPSWSTSPRRARGTTWRTGCSPTACRTCRIRA